MSRILAPLLLVLIVGGTVALYLMRQPPALPDLQAGTVLERPLPVPAFTLVDQHGGAFSHADLHGDWNLLFTGFTSCPDICPTTLIDMNTLQRRLQADDAAPRMIFLSVDPARDSPEVMARYIAHFSPDVLGLTGDETEIRRLCDVLGLSYVHVPDVGERYTVDHAGTLLLIDPRGRVTAYFKPPLDVERIANDLSAVGGVMRQDI